MVIVEFLVTMFTNGHTNGVNDSSDEEELDFDMWEGQFEFVGSNVVNQNEWNDFYQNNSPKKTNSDQV